MSERSRDVGRRAVPIIVNGQSGDRSAFVESLCAGLLSISPCLWAASRSRSCCSSDSSAESIEACLEVVFQVIVR